MSESLLESHLILAEEAYTLLLEENKTLKVQGNTLDSDAIARKEALMVRLDTATQQLNKLRAQSGPVEGIKSQELIQKIQNKLMQIFLLNKENEELILRNDFNDRQISQSSRVSQSSAKQLYSSIKP